MRYAVLCPQPLTVNAGEYIVIQDGVAVEVLAPAPVPVPPPPPAQAMLALEPPAPPPPPPPPAQEPERIVPTEKDVLDFFKVHPDASFSTTEVIRGLVRRNLMTWDLSNRQMVSRFINKETRHIDGQLEISPSLRLRYHAYRLRQKGS